MKLTLFILLNLFLFAQISYAENSSKKLQCDKNLLSSRNQVRFHEWKNEKNVIKRIDMIHKATEKRGIENESIKKIIATFETRWEERDYETVNFRYVVGDFKDCNGEVFAYAKLADPLFFNKCGDYEDKGSCMIISDKGDRDFIAVCTKKENAYDICYFDDKKGEIHIKSKDLSDVGVVGVDARIVYFLNHVVTKISMNVDLNKIKTDKDLEKVYERERRGVNYDKAKELSNSYNDRAISSGAPK